jgi:RimJ/RimL family protein N-acetyltransferase
MTQPVTPNPMITTAIDQPIGEIVPNWTPRPHPLDNPQYHTLQGQYCRLELLNSKTNDNIIQQLYDAFKPTEQTHFTYLHYGPFKTVDELKQLIHSRELPSSDTVLYSILVDNIAVGFISYLRVNQAYGTIEIGNLSFSSQLARSRAATEATFLLIQHAFDVLGYRRVEWSCYSLNAKSRRAALRFGFQYEGTWIKAQVCKGRSRDNAWFSIVDDEWAPLKQEFQRWLNPENFDSHGQQLTKLNNAQINPRSNTTNTDII